MTKINLIERLWNTCSHEKQSSQMTKEVTNLLSDTAKRRQKDGKKTATSDKVIIRTSLGHFLRYVAMIFAVLVMSVANVGTAWGQTSWVRLDSIDFTNTTTWSAQTISGTSSANTKTTVNGVFFNAKKAKSIKINNTTPGVDFDGQNGDASNHIFGIPVSGVNGSLKVIVYHDYNTTSAKFKVGISHADGNDPSKSQTWDQSLSDAGTKNKNDYVLTKSSLTGTDYIVWVVEAGTSYKVVKKVAIYTEAPSCDAADLTASNITSNGDQEAGTGITFSKVGSPASGDTWYWQTSATGTDKTYNATYTTATTAGSYTVYLRAYNTAGNCWGKAASMTNTIYPAPSAMIHNTFAVNAAWGSTIATQDKTNITSLNAMAAVGESVGTNSNKEGLTQKIPSQSSEDASKYMSLSFNVASGKQLNVTSVVFDEQPVTGTGTFKVSISDNQGSTTKTQTIASGAAGSKHTLTLDGDIVGSFKGTVTVKVWAYGWDAGYRFGDYFYIHGTVTATAACVAPNHVDISSSTGEFGFFGGETITLTAQAYSSAGTGSPIAEGSITGYQWKRNGTNISGATSKTLTISNCTVSNAGDYSCVVSTGATCSTESSSYGTKVYVLQQYIGGETTYNFTRVGTSKVGTVNVTLAASTQREFKIYAGTMTSESYYMGNNGTIDEDASNWDFEGGKNNVKLNPGLGGTFTFTIDYTANGGAPKVSVTYPRKTIYLTPGVWNADGAKFAIHYFRDGGSTGWTDFLTANDCGMSAEIPQWNGITIIPVRFNPSDATPGWNGAGHVWNQTNNITLNSNNSVVITGWNASDFTYGTYAVPTYTISYAKGSVPTGGESISGSKSNETKTCGVDFTLPSSAVFTTTGYTQTGWTTSDGGAQEYALGGTYTTNEDKTFYPVWTVNQYTVTHTLDGVTKSSGATGANAATYGTNYTAVFAASSGYALPETITVTIGGSTKTQGTEYTWDQASGTVTITGSYITGNIVITITGESDDPCSEPAEVTNEIARFFVPCGLTNATSVEPSAWAVTNEDASTGDNTFTTSGFGGGSSNWYRNGTSGLIYGKLSGNNSYIQLKLKSGNFQAGDVVTAYFNRNSGTKTGLKLKDKDSGNSFEPTASASDVETSGTYTLKAADIENDGSIKFFRTNSSTYVNRIIVTRPACTNVSITTQPTTPVAATVGSACSITGLVAAGTSPTYQWYTCNSDGSSATAINAAGTLSFTGYTTATLGLTPTATGATYYKCVVSGSCGDPVTSSVVTVNASAAPASALVTYDLNVGTSASTSIGTSGTSTDPTNITSIAISQANAAGDGAGASNRTTKLPLATGENAASVDDPNKYVLFTFNVACGKKLTPTEVKIKVANVGSSAGGNQNYKAVLSDTYGHSISNTFTGTKSDGTVEEFSITNGGGTYFQGDVTLKIWSCKGSGGNASAFRMGTPLEIYGEVANQATPAATITWNTQPANGRVGDPDFAYDVTCSDGSAVTVTSANTTYATIVGGKLHYAAAGTTHLVASATDACGNTVTPVNSNDFTVSAAAATYSVTHSLTNVTATSGATGAGAATEGVAYEAVFAANTGYVLPSTITVTIGGSPATVGTGYTWNASTGAFQVPAAQVTGAIVITIAGETAPATKDIYYGAITITAGALTKGSTGTVQFFTNTGGTIANNTEISLSTTLGAGSEYYLSNDLTGAELSKSSNWTTSSSSNRYVQGVKFGSGKSYTLALGSKVASSITFYGINGSASKTMTIGGQAWTSSSTKNTFAKHEFTKSGNFTGNVSITQDGDFYGILVITIQTATPCTTPVIPALSNQSLCEGTDIAEWDATQTAVLADGETVTYSWKKKGNDTELANTATLDLGSSATESQAGTYVVTVTVSKAGKASSSAYREVELSVTDGEEVTSITADKATVYPGNSVTLTATANTPATWQWYTCTNAEGDGEVIISGAESASYTIASAGAAGTYYYKAKATGSCGTAERVYTLTVTAASECEKYFWFVYAADATSNGVINNRDNFFGSSPKTGSSNSSSYKFTLDGTEYTATRNTGDNTFSISFTVPEGSTATLALNCKGSSSKPIYLIPTSGDPVLITDNSSNAAHVVENIAAGTYRVGAKTDASASWTLAGMAVQVCTASSCTDATPTIAAVNNTVCVGTKMRIDATGYEDGASFKWQKLNGSTWDDVAGAILDSLVIASAAAENAGSYRLVATKECARTSNTVTISVPLAPNFGSTVPASVSVMQTIALSINTVEATDAVKYRWYKSADPTWDAGDVEIGTNKELIKAYDSEAIGSPSYYIFCRAQNACGITTSTAIAVNVTAYVEEDCATRGNESDAEFGFQNSGAGQGSYESTACWTMNSNSKILVYSAPDGKYFKTMKVTIASSSASKASYNWSTNGGSSYTADGVAITGVTTTLTEKTIDLSAHGNVNEVKIGRNFGNGESSGTLYLSKICFEYTDACTATTVTPSTASTNYEMDGSSFTEPTFTVKHGGTAFDPQPTLTYSSSNEDIASVDDDGTVTFNGEAGTVTITASYAGDGTYCASSGSYTINVSCPGGAPKVVASGSVEMSGCNSSVTLLAKTQSDGDFADGTYQWFRNGEEIDGATSSSYTATQAGTYTVERTNTSGCTTPSTNSAVVTSETTEPEVERLVPFQYYHVDKEDYSDQMKMRHLFAVKNSGKLDGKSFKMYVSRNGGAATDVTSSNALEVWPNGDGHVDTVMVDLNKLKGKYSENDELVFTCKAIDCSKNISDVYKNTITMRVIGATPTLALICSGSNKAGGTRKTGELTVGGDFLTGYNVADLCQQTGNTSFDANTEWGLYTRLKENYIVTPVNGYAVFNKLNYEPFDILLLTDYPKASKSDAAATVLDDMADLCDYRPMLSFKAHMVAKQPSKWAAKGFTTSPVVPKNTRTRLNIVCYAHPMFADMKTTATHIQKDNDDPSQIVYTMLTGAGYESSKGLQGFELEAAENFVTIGLVHYNATPADGSPSAGLVTWTPGSEDRMLVTAVERQENLEARMIMFAVNCGAQSKFTETGRNVVLKCLEYLLDDDPLHVADCSFTFDNGAGNSRDAAKQAEDCPSCTGTKGDGKWSTAANWGPDYVVRPGKDTEVKIAAPVTVDPAVGAGAAANFTPKVRSVRILEGGQVEIPAGSYLEVVSTIRRQDGNDIYPTEVEDLHIGSSATGNGTLIFNNSTEDTKAQVDMYSKGFIDHSDPANEPKGVKNYQYIGTPFVEVNALYNYYGSWIYYWKADGSGWKAVKNGGPMTAWTGYCITQEEPTYHQMSGTLTATGTVDINVPADANMVVGNSWTAPIDISKFATTDFENLVGNVYFFNTGVDKKGEGTVNDQATGATRWAAGTYVSVPIHAASYTDTDDHIPSLQGFFVKNTSSSAGTLHLDYDKHVRGSSRAGRLSEEMHAPARRIALSSDEPTVLKIKVSGENYDDKLLLLEREDFTEGFDNGWDGDKWDGNESALYIYTTDNEGTENSVSAVPELEGTIIGFRAGEEDDAYTLNFEYLNSDEPLYLYDSENSSYTRIMTGVTYRFFTTDKSKHARFIITRKSPQITTAVGNVSDDGLRSSKVKKLLLDNKLFILRNGMLYDATGKVVK